jgi:hypothetical protein
VLRSNRDCENDVCCADMVNTTCNGDAPNNDNQCCGDLVCHDQQDRCCVASGDSCVNGNTNDGWCCSGTCNNGTNNCD